MNECEFCKKSFSSFQALQLHIKTAKKCLMNRENFDMVECDYCLKEFPGKESLQRHHLTCRFKEKFADLVEENKTLKAQVSVLQQEILLFKRAKKKEEHTKKKKLLDVQNFEEEFMSLVRSTKTEIVLQGIKEVLKDILIRSERLERKLWSTNKKLRKIFYIENGTIFSEKEEDNGKICSLAYSCMYWCEETMREELRKETSKKGNHNIEMFGALANAMGKYSPTDEKKIKEFWSVLMA